MTAILRTNALKRATVRLSTTNGAVLIGSVNFHGPLAILHPPLMMLLLLLRMSVGMTLARSIAWQ